jgi:hypothetical protein
VFEFLVGRLYFITVQMMKRSRRILICLACAMVLSTIVRADSPSTSAPPGPDAMRQKMVQMNKAFLLKKLHQRKPIAGMPMAGGVPLGIPSTPNSLSKHTAAASVSTDTTQPGNPYASIVTRNVFGLNPPTPPDTSTDSGPPPPKITLTGITTIFGPAEALFKVAGVPRLGKPPKDESYILTEGQGQDDVDVTHIDVTKGIVTFNNHGVVQDIPLVAGVASGGDSGSGGGGGGFQRPQFGGPPGRPGFNNIQNFRQRLQQQRAAQYNNSDNANPSGLTSDDQAALIAAQHAQMQQDGNPMAALFPPTSYDNDAQNAVNPGTTPADSTPSASTPVVRQGGLFRPSGNAGPAAP